VIVEESPSAAALTPYVQKEVLDAFGFAPGSWSRRLLAPIFWPPSRLAAGLAAGIERNARLSGLPGAAAWVLPHFVQNVHVSGADQIPLEGPVIVGSNHPGAYDAFAVVANLPRKDIGFVVSDVPILRSLPEVDSHLIYVPEGPLGRMTAIRGMIRHLEAGGLVFLFPSGLVDPDPDLLPGAAEALGQWSPSLAVAMRRVPETRMVPAIVSSVLAESCLRSPLTRLQHEPWRQRKLAEFLQVIEQLVFKRDFGLVPRLSFGPAMNLKNLATSNPGQDLTCAIITQARLLLESHMKTKPAVSVA
jgi:hypothetical protein